MIRIGGNFFYPWSDAQCMAAFVRQHTTKLCIPWPEDALKYCEDHAGPYLDFAANYASDLEDCAGDDAYDLENDK